MPDRTELLEAALDSFPEGVALADVDGRVAFWNQAAQAITGYSGGKLVGLPVREALNTLIAGGVQHWIAQADTQPRGVRIHVRHRLGHNFPAIARVLVLRDGLGRGSGRELCFIPQRASTHCRAAKQVRTPMSVRANWSSKRGWRRYLKILNAGICLSAFFG